MWGQNNCAEFRQNCGELRRSCARLRRALRLLLRLHRRLRRELLGARLLALALLLRAVLLAGAHRRLALAHALLRDEGVVVRVSWWRWPVEEEVTMVAVAVAARHLRRVARRVLLREIHRALPRHAVVGRGHAGGQPPPLRALVAGDPPWEGGGERGASAGGAKGIPPKNCAPKSAGHAWRRRTSRSLRSRRPSARRPTTSPRPPPRS